MAERPVFIAGNKNQWVKRENTLFPYFSGFSDTQRKKCIQSLHQAFLKEHPKWNVLEISSHSPKEEGVLLSAFNLTVLTKSGEKATVECAYQAGKVFEKGGPYLDLLNGTSKDAKKDARLKESGRIIGFEFDGERFPSVPQNFFYNWLYLKGLSENPKLGDCLMNYEAFTDIVFNPNNSQNCQAEAAALYVSLRREGLLDQAMAGKEAFLQTVYHREYPKEVFFQPEQPEISPVNLKPKRVCLPAFKAGECFLHPKFGEGTILSVKKSAHSCILLAAFSCGKKELSGEWVAKNCKALKKDS